VLFRSIGKIPTRAARVGIFPIRGSGFSAQRGIEFDFATAVKLTNSA
jgi:hypothetical protein